MTLTFLHILKYILAGAKKKKYIGKILAAV
jgi:hypothetical protein